MLKIQSSLSGAHDGHVSSPLFWSVTVAVVFVWFSYDDAFRSLWVAWTTTDEYSHGMLIPFISLFLLYQKKNELRQVPFVGSWFGVFLVLAGGILHLAGRLAVVSTIGQYALLLCVAGAFLSLMGSRAFRLVWVALVMLIFMVKLPTFVFNNLSSQLQLISSEIGVWVIRLFDISVHLEGNVIDLGVLKLQVVEACSGLRYLFPLMALSMIMAVFYKARWWQKWIVFLSSIPITVLMNSFRIGLVGVTVEYWGKSMAEGFLHDFEGWFVFMTAFFVLFVEVLLLNWIVGDKLPLAEVLSLDMPASIPENEDGPERDVPRQFLVALVVMCVFAFSNQFMSVGENSYPDRVELDGFPLVIDNRLGTRSYLEPAFLTELQVDDYIVVDYKSSADAPINLYIAYYDVQAEGAGTIHSPRSCLPGAGWRIDSLQQKDVPGVAIGETPLKVNKAIISKGGDKVLVYYWMQQRGRVITNEFMAKWWIFWDRIIRQRSDGALVRIMMRLDNDASIDVADAKMQRFIAEVAKDIPRFVPD